MHSIMKGEDIMEAFITFLSIITIIILLATTFIQVKTIKEIKRLNDETKRLNQEAILILNKTKIIQKKVN